MIKKLSPILVLVLTISCFSSIYTHGESSFQGEPSAYGEKQTFDIPAGPLAVALNNYALYANVIMYFDPALAKGRSTKGLTGTFTVQEGFAVLLQGTGLIAQRDASGHYTISHLVSSSDDSVVQLDLLKVHARDIRAQAIYESPSSDSVVKKEQIERLPPRDTSDVLASVSGLHTSQSRQEPGVSINIRGLQDFGRVNMMIDGVRQNFQRSGHGSNGALYMDPQMLAGVDVSKGPSSKSGGAAVIGGVVNFRTIDFEDLIEEQKNAGGRISLSGGSNAYYFSGNVAAATHVTDDVSVMFALGSKRVGAFKKGTQGGNAGDEDTVENGESDWEGVSQFTDQSQQSALFKTQWQFTDEQLVKFSYIGFKADFDEGDDTADQAAESENTLKADTALINYQWRSDNPLLDLSSSLYFSKTVNDQFRRETEDLSDPYGEFDVHYETNTAGGMFGNRSVFDLSSIDSVLNLNYGTEFYYDWTRPSASRLTEGEGRASWFTGPTPEGDRWLASIFSQTEFSHSSGLDVLAGLRYDYFSLEGDGQMYVGSIDNPDGVRPTTTDLYSNFSVARNKGYVSPALTLSYQLNDNIQLFSSYKYGVRPPSITETLMWGQHVGNGFPFFPNPGLQTEKSRSFELGTNFQYSNLVKEADQLNLKTIWFDSRVDNYITQAPVMSAAQIEVKPGKPNMAFVNLESQVRFYGYELQAEYHSQYFFSEFSWTRTMTDLGRGGYDPFPLGSIVGFPPTTLGQSGTGSTFYLTSPEIKTTWTNGLQLLDQKLVFGLRIRMEDNAGRGGSSYEDVVDWQVYDIWCTYQANSWLTANVSVDNVTDENYAELNGLSYWIAPGRTAIATLTARF